MRRDEQWEAGIPTKSTGRGYAWIPATAPVDVKTYRRGYKPRLAFDLYNEDDDWNYQGDNVLEMLKDLGIKPINYFTTSDDKLVVTFRTEADAVQAKIMWDTE